MTYGFGLGAGLQALQAARLAIQTAGHNVANVNTPGFTRQRVMQSATFPYSVSRGFQIGTGVQIDDVQRLYDEGIERRLQLQLGMFGGAEVLHSRWREIETALGEPDGGIGNSLSELFTRLGRLRTEPSDRALRGAVVQGAKSMAQGFNMLSDRFRELAGSTFDEVRGLLRQVNEHAAAVAALNREIVAAEANGSTANDLRDTRGQHITAIAELVDVRTHERGSGAVDVLVGGYLMVSGTSVTPLHANRDGSAGTGVQIGDSSRTLDLRGGRIGALLALEQEQLPGFSGGIDALARDLILQLNRVHTTGVPGSGPFRSLTAHNGVVDGDGDGNRGDELLSQSGLPFDISRGELWVAVTRLDTGDIERRRIAIDPGAMTLQDLAAELDGLDHINATVDPVGRLRIDAEDGYGFDFANRLDRYPDTFGSFGGANPSFASGGTGPFALTVPASFTVTVDGAPQAVNLTASDFADPSRATTDELVAALNAQLGTAATARSVNGHLVVRSNTGGDSATMSLADGAGSPLAAIGLTAGVTRAGRKDGVEVTLSGAYTGDDNRRLTFRADQDGEIGVTPNLTVGVFDDGGRRIATLRVGRGEYEPGSSIDVVDGIKVAFGPGGISATAGDVFGVDALADSDSSDVLVALGMNSFLLGHDAATIRVNPELEGDPDLFAAGITDAAGDSANVVRMLDVRGRNSGALGNSTIEDFYNDLVGEVGFETATATSTLQAQQQLLEGLQAERESISGVNLDEEMVDLVRFQQAFEAASRFINTVSELSRTLMDLAR